MAASLAFVLDIHVDVSLAVRRRELRLAAQRNGRHYLAAGRIDNRGVLALGVEGEDVLGVRVVQNCIRPFADFDLVRHFQRFQIEGSDTVVAAVADESAVQLRSQRHAVDAG